MVYGANGGGVMNIVTINRILELSETKTRFEKIKKFSCNWRLVCVTSLVVITLKVAMEQLAMLLR